MNGRSQDDDRDYRMGSAALGLLMGLFLGLACAVAALVLSNDAPSFAHFVFGGGAVGVIAGALFPRVVLNAFEGVLHFLLGFFSGADVNFEIEQSRHARPWLRTVFWLGLVAGLALCLFYWL